MVSLFEGIFLLVPVSVKLMSILKTCKNYNKM